MGLGEALADLEERLRDPACGAAGRLMAAVLDRAGARSPLALDAQSFAGAAEGYYRETLRLAHIAEAFDVLRPEITALDAWDSWRQGLYNRPLWGLLGGGNALEFWDRAAAGVRDETLDAPTLRTLIHLLLLTLHRQMGSPTGPLAPARVPGGGAA
jgi:hypothetical protein